jgi:hypothetical protein
MVLPSGLRQKFSCRSAPGWVVKLTLEGEVAQQEPGPSQMPLLPTQPAARQTCPSLTQACVGSDSSIVGTQCPIG